jgi:lactoylglutathione lyase
VTVKLDHVNISVSNLSESIEWYNKIFGFELVEKGRSAQGKKWGIVASNDSMICMTEYNNKMPADKIENESVHQIYHFGIRVTDLDRWRATVEKNNLQLYYGGEVEYPHSRSWYIHDPSGHEIEVSFADGERLNFPGIEV